MKEREPPKFRPNHWYLLEWGRKWVRMSRREIVWAAIASLALSAAITGSLVGVFVFLKAP